MQHRIFLFVPAILAAAFVVGCGNTSPTGGGTPATKTNVGGGTETTTSTFKLKGPTLSPTIKQGEKQVVNLTVDRDSTFKQGVKLSAEAPKGLKVDMNSKMVAAGDKGDVQVTIEADKDAPVGDHNVKITATPDAGAATSLDMKVKVEAAK